jgi:PDZ domain-containing protein
VLEPGRPVPLTSRISLGRRLDLRAGGEVLMLTVEARQTNVFEYALARFAGSSRQTLVERDAVIPAGIASRDYQRHGQDQMQESIGLASVVALRAAGYSASAYGEGARVVALTAGSPDRANALRTNDLIVVVGGTPVRLAGDIRQDLRARSPGQAVRVVVMRAGELTELQVTLVPAPSGAEELMLGAVLRSVLPRFTLAVPVRVNAAGISGPSGGLAMALAIYQAVCGADSDILGGRIVAASGFLRADGSVGPVGGAGLKARAAAAAGASLLFVSRANADEARKQAPAITVVPVDHFAEVVTYLRQLDRGGLTLPK